MSTFKDLFSKQAGDYAKFRPNYQPELFQYLQTLTEKHDLAWDVGTGNGQAAVFLAEHYKQVIATDPSEKQIANAVQNEKIEYVVASAENSGLPDQSVDLVAVAQAFHWFKQPEFFAEVSRKARPGAVLAIWCYELAQINKTVDAAVMELYDGVLGPYWEKERKLVEQGYKNEKIPFNEIQPPKFQLKAEWSLEHLVGYLSTWSALQSFIKKNNKNPLEDFYPRLEAAWGQDKNKTVTKSVTWELGLRVFRI